MKKFILILILMNQFHYSFSTDIKTEREKYSNMSIDELWKLATCMDSDMAKEINRIKDEQQRKNRIINWLLFSGKVYECPSEITTPKAASAGKVSRISRIIKD
jgi:hypothetical protein